MTATVNMNISLEVSYERCEYCQKKPPIISGGGGGTHVKAVYTLFILFCSSIYPPFVEDALKVEGALLL